MHNFKPPRLGRTIAAASLLACGMTMAAIPAVASSAARATATAPNSTIITGQLAMRQSAATPARLVTFVPAHAPGISQGPGVTIHYSNGSTDRVGIWFDTYKGHKYLLYCIDPFEALSHGQPIEVVRNLRGVSATQSEELKYVLWTYSPPKTKPACQGRARAARNRQTSLTISTDMLPSA